MVCFSSNRENKSVELLKTEILIDEIGLPKLKGKQALVRGLRCS